MYKLLVRAINNCVLVYAFGVVVWFFFNRLYQDSWWGLVVLDKFAEYFVLPAIIFFVASLITRQSSTILLSIIPISICLFFYGSFFWPVSTPTLLPQEQRLRLATYNLWNHNNNISQVVTELDNIQADVIALQEITEVQRPLLVEGLKSKYPHYYVSKPVYGGTTALFSKLPLRNVKELDIQIDRASIVADTVWNGKNIAIASAHLNPSFWAYWQQPWRKIPANYHQYIKDQNTQVLAILDELSNRENVEASFLACDCNSQETASTNRLLAKHFREAFRSVGWQVGNTGSEYLVFEKKLTHIDYIWFRGAAKPNAVYRWKQTVGSDHHPVIADFAN